MNCENYLSMLETLPVEELAYGDARTHALSCRDCDRVTRVVAERERNMVTAFGDLYPSVPAGQIAARALVMARRRTVALYYRIALGGVAIATVLFMVVSRRPGPFARAVVSETFQLQCLSPAQAAAVLRQVSNTTMISFRPNPPLGIIKVRGSRAEMARVHAVLDKYDNPAESQCAVQITVPNVPKVP